MDPLQALREAYRNVSCSLAVARARLADLTSNISAAHEAAQEAQDRLANVSASIATISSFAADLRAQVEAMEAGVANETAQAIKDVPDSPYYGDVFIAAFNIEGWKANVTYITHIYGTLTIFIGGWSFSEIKFLTRTLKYVSDSLIIDGQDSTFSSASFFVLPLLKEIGGSLIIQKTSNVSAFVFPSLFALQFGFFYSLNPNLAFQGCNAGSPTTILSFPLLNNVTNILKFEKLGCVSTQFPRLVQIHGIFRFVNSSVESLSFEKLSIVSSHLEFLYSSFPPMTSSFPLLSTVNGLFQLISLRNVQQMLFPRLSYIGGKTSIVSNANLTRVEFPSLSYLVASLYVQNNPSLVSFELPGTMIEGSFTIFESILSVYANPSLEVIFLQKCKFLNSIAITGNDRLTTVNASSCVFASNARFSLGGNSEETDFIVDIDLSSTDTIESLLLYNIHCGHLFLPNLALISRDLIVSSMLVENEEKALSFPRLTTVGRDLSLIINKGVRTVDFPSLVSVENVLNVTSNRDLRFFSAPVLQNVGGEFFIFSNKNLLGVNTSNVETVGGSLTLSFCQDLESIAFPNLRLVSGSLYINSTSLASVGLMGLRSVVENLMVVNAKRLQVFSASNLTSIGGNLTFFSNAALTNISFAQLASVGESIKIQECSSLRDLSSSFSCKTFGQGHAQIIPTSVEICSNRLLSDISSIPSCLLSIPRNATYSIDIPGLFCGSCSCPYV